MGMTYKGARARRVSLPGKAYPIPWRISGKSCVCPARHMTLQSPPEYWSLSSRGLGRRFASLCKISSEPFRLLLLRTQARFPRPFIVAYLSVVLPSAVVSSSIDRGDRYVSSFPLLLPGEIRNMLFELAPYAPMSFLRVDAVIIMSHVLPSCACQYLRLQQR